MYQTEVHISAHQTEVHIGETLEWSVAAAMRAVATITVVTCSIACHYCGQECFGPYLFLYRLPETDVFMSAFAIYL